ncbi:MAG: TVP38/TMEM64 family protein [Gemmatimonadales bacterium]
MTRAEPRPAADSRFRRSSRWLSAGALAFIVGLGALLLGGRTAAVLIPGFTARLSGLGALAPLAFLLGYVVATVAFVPGSILTLAAGALFGLWKGTLLAFVAATLGAAAAFLVSRYLAREFVHRRLAGDERAAAIDRAIGDQGRKIVFLLRLSPVFPFNLLNYALGLTTVRFTDYLIASLGMLPGTFLYVYWGKAVGDVARLAGPNPIRGSRGYYALLGIGLVATIAVVAIVTRAARRALQALNVGQRAAL